MKTFLSFLILAVALLAGAFLAPQATLTVLSVAALSVGAVYIVANHNRTLRRSRLVGAVNAIARTWGTHTNSVTLLATAAIATRYLIVKRGADAQHLAAVTATADVPIGVCTDEPEAAEEPANVELLGLTNKTVVMVASGVIALDADVYMTATGKVSAKPTAAGTYWRVGRALMAATADTEEIEVQPCKPRKLIVVAALTQAAGDIADTNSTAVNPTKADFDSLLVAAGKLQADFLVLSTALSGDADVTVATS